MACNYEIRLYGFALNIRKHIAQVVFFGLLIVDKSILHWVKSVHVIVGLFMSLFVFVKLCLCVE